MIVLSLKFVWIQYQRNNSFVNVTYRLPTEKRGDSMSITGPVTVCPTRWTTSNMISKPPTEPHRHYWYWMEYTIVMIVVRINVWYLLSVVHLRFIGRHNVLWIYKSPPFLVHHTQLSYIYCGHPMTKTHPKPLSPLVRENVIIDFFTQWFVVAYLASSLITFRGAPNWFRSCVKCDSNN